MARSVRKGSAARDPARRARLRGRRGLLLPGLGSGGAGSGVALPRRGSAPARIRLPPAARGPRHDRGSGRGRRRHYSHGPDRRHASPGAERTVHILFVTQFFTPEVGATQTRIHEFARACARAGHRVTVLTELPNHPRGMILPAYQGRILTREKLDGITVLRVWVWTAPIKTFWSRLAFYGTFFALATVRGLVIRGPVDVVFATSPPLPVGLIGWVLARSRRARSVPDIRDLWPAAARAPGEQNR